MKPVAQRDLARLRPRCHALRDNRSLLRITPAAPPRRSGQNLHPTKTVPIPCCGSAMHVIGEDRSQRLDVIPAQYQVVVTRRPKYACRTCQGAVVQAPAPARLIEGGLPTEQLVAHVVVAKYADHCPLYRQAQILARQGITIWCGRA